MTFPLPLASLRDAARRASGSLRNRLDPPLVILLYHRVCDLPHDPHRMAVAPSRFREQLERLRDGMPIVGLDEAGSRRRAPAAVITFDDGYADNLIEALPILESLRVPATFFIATGNVASGREFWWDELEPLVRDGERPTQFTLDDPAHGGTWPTATDEQRERLARDLHVRMRRVNAERRENWLAVLRAWAGRATITRPSHRPVTVEELRRLGASPWVSIGAHTVNHPSLAALGEREQREEIESSKAQLERWLGREVRSFSFPFGERRDFNPASVRLCRAAGFHRTATNRPGTAHRWTDPHRLPRHVVRDWPAEEFERRLQQFILS